MLAQTLPLLRKAGLRQRVLTTRALESQPTGELAGVPVTRHTYLYPEWPLSAARHALYDRRAGNLVSFPLARHLLHLKDLALVHCHTGNRLGAQCLRVARRRQVPCVLTLHGGHFAVPDEERQRWGRASAPEAESGNAFPSLPWGKALSLFWGTRDLLESVDAVVCVGIEEYEEARRKLRRPRVVLLPGGVDVAAFEGGGRERGRHLLKVPGDALLVTCVARLDPQKDQETLLRAWLRLPSQNVFLALVGAETEPGYAQRLREIARAAGDRLRIVDNMESDRIPDVLAAADVAVLPSRHEPFGLSCLEAWAAGTCLVASNVGGPRWLLEGETAGRLFPAGDVARLSELLLEVLDDPAQRKRIVGVGERRARAEFTWEHRAESLLDLYESLGVRWVRHPLGSGPSPRSVPGSEEFPSNRSGELRPGGSS